MDMTTYETGADNILKRLCLEGLSWGHGFQHWEWRTPARAVPEPHPSFGSGKEAPPYCSGGETEDQRELPRTSHWEAAEPGFLYCFTHVLLHLCPPPHQLLPAPGSSLLTPRHCSLVT